MNIRNFAIIAHIDHGKSTLADRIMELTGAVGKVHKEQLLDSLELEREHGITIKLKAIRLNYMLNANHLDPQSEGRGSHGTVFTLNLIDTPGHVDFSYEVSRSLASVEGAVLVVDATQGVQAQTLANFNLALESNITIVPVINKIDSPAANVDETEKEIKALGFKDEEILKVSAKTGEGVDKLLQAIIEKIPEPSRTDDKQSALIFDSSLDPYQGVVATVRSFGSKIKVGDKVKFLATDITSEILQIGYLSPKPVYVEDLEPNQVGFLVTNLKDLSRVKVGDTITSPINPSQPLLGYKQVKPVVFLSFFPTDPHNLPKLKLGLDKLKLSDSSLSYSNETSLSLGQGFRLGFLGLLHSQITQERLEREYDLDIIVTSPSVNFKVDGEIINKASDFDGASKNVEEPYAKVTIFAPQKYYGVISGLIYEKRGEQGQIENFGNSQKIEAKIPLLEILIGFYDQLKTQTSGYASFDYEIDEYRPAKLSKLDILVNHEPVEGLAQIVPTERAEIIGRKLVEKLKEAIPRQQIAVPIQAAIGGKIIARETVASFRKDVTQKLYGGDVTRKMKLLGKQKKGKKRMRRFGQVDIPQEAFLAVLKI